MNLKIKILLITTSLTVLSTLAGVVHALNMESLGGALLEQANTYKRHGDSEKHHRQNESCDRERELRSITGNVHTKMKFVNNTNQEVRSYWLDYNGRRVFYKAIPPNSSYTQPTYKTHPWLITDQVDKCLKIFRSNNRSEVVKIR